MKSLRHIIALLGLFSFLISGQAGAQGYIWCLGEDGHTELEFAVGDNCGSSSQLSDEPAPCHDVQASPCVQCDDLCEGAVEEEHCGPCVDIPASYDAASRRAHDDKKIKDQVSFPAAVQVASLPTYTRTLTTHLYPQPPPRISQTILAHRTVVLLN